MSPGRGFFFADALVAKNKCGEAETYLRQIAITTYIPTVMLSVSKSDSESEYSIDAKYYL